MSLPDNTLHMSISAEIKQESEQADACEESSFSTSPELEVDANMNGEQTELEINLPGDSLSEPSTCEVLPDEFPEPPRKKQYLQKDLDSPSTSKKMIGRKNRSSSVSTSSDDTIDSEFELNSRTSLKPRLVNDECRTHAPYLESDAAFRKKVIDLQCEIIGYLVELKNLIIEQRAEIKHPVRPSEKLAEVQQKPGSAAVIVKPLSSLDELKELEENLIDVDLRTKLIEQCHKIGGVDFKDMVKNVMKRVMKKSLMVHLNMSGQRSKESGKHPFKRSLLCSCIADAVLLRFSELSQTDVIRHIQFILKYCKRYKDWN